MDDNNQPQLLLDSGQSWYETFQRYRTIWAASTADKASQTTLLLQLHSDFVQFCGRVGGEHRFQDFSSAMLAMKRTGVSRDRNGWKLVWRGAEAACFAAGEAWRVKV